MSEENKNTEEEQAISNEQPAKDEVISSAERLTEVEQPQTQNLSSKAIAKEDTKPQTEDMEIHKHPHHVTHKKNWGEYLLEFLMLFFAVFLGFIAENEREHMVEHQREKKFMVSLVEDLETDTIELKKAIGKADSTAQYADSVLFFLLNYKISSEIPARIANLIATGGQRLTLINTDRTSSQLKNSGSMRLIRDKEVSTAILKYWKKIDETNISLDRYLTYRNAGREILFKLWVIPEVYQHGFLMKQGSIEHLRVIDPDRKKWDEMINLIAISGSIARVGHKNNLITQFDMATSLILLIKKEYHLE
jgi:hypothetical protein